MSRHLIPGTLAAVLAVGLAQGQSTTAQLTGVIVDENGKPLPGAHILYTRNPKLVKGADGKWHDAPGEMPFSSQTASNATGNYQLA